jgi:tRNA (guanine-N7-)-methyltransferase
VRLRKKTWARSSLLLCDFFVTNPTNYVGKWSSKFEKNQPIWLELGCGKGAFISKLASSNLDKNFIAIDIKDEILVLAKEKIEKEYSSQGILVSNIKLVAHEIMIIHKILNWDDLIDGIYINFCNPWYKNHHHTRRLTYPNQLRQYSAFLKPKGTIRFKTDNTPFFRDSINYFERSGFKIIYKTEDLYNSDYTQNIETEHEKMYAAQGAKINFLIAEKF